MNTRAKKIMGMLQTPISSDRPPDLVSNIISVGLENEHHCTKVDVIVENIEPAAGQGNAENSSNYPELTELKNVPIERDTIEVNDTTPSSEHNRGKSALIIPEMTELMNIPMEKSTIEDDDSTTSSLERDNPFSTDSDSDYIPDTDDTRNNNRSLVNYFSMSSEDDNNEIISSEEENQTIADGEELEPPKSRKRKRKVNAWKRNEMKKRRNLGQTYTNTKNEMVPERKLKEACKNTCRLKCVNKISKDMRLSIFSEYWALGDVNRQRDFILRFVDFRKKNRQRLRRNQNVQRQEDISDEDNDVNVGDNSRRKMTYFYHLSSEEGEREKVCQTFFLNTLGISHQVVKTVAAKLNISENNVVTIDGDNRGRNNITKTRISQRQELLVKDHINSFEAVESHYTRKDSSKKYLPGSLNISKMFRLYMDYCKENRVDKKDIVRESMYRWIFVNKFNIGFHIPKKDQCDLCVNYQNSNDAEKVELKLLVESHLLNKEAMRKKKDDDKLKASADNSFCLAIFDLQQVLQCPKIEVGQAYYKSKIATYNLTVYEAAKKQGYCYMWHEAIASRGTCEIGSCVLKFIKMKADSGCREISFYSDNCAGQNKNKFMYIMLLYAAVTNQVEITLSFMEVGHTQNEGDSMHSAIERCARRIPIYTPGQWATIARTACVKKRYFVNELNQTDFFDFKDLLAQCTKKLDKDTCGTIVKWTDISCVQVDFAKPDILKFAYKLQEGFYEINIKEGSRKESISFLQYNLKPLRNRLISISKIKYDSIIYYCTKNAVAKEYQDFFLSLPHE
ncbi:unnamed protein product [Ceutorhynchus assimilis]|uniref:DUF7869 domain-containing protein n=1 Tax=Ceutorhynchus assimilis TaxID=467358 RepID=A0A9N9QLD9_9CUCU|nr:unnamed protein product [Ceutorhynchus assimilis]